MIPQQGLPYALLDYSPADYSLHPRLHCQSTNHNDINMIVEKKNQSMFLLSYINKNQE